MSTLDDTVALLRRVLDTENHRKNTRFDHIQEGQTPEIVGVVCGDSRVNEQMVDDNPHNHYFSVATIGNQVVQLMGSVVYPTAHIESVRLLVDVGHLRCGYMAGAINLAEELEPNIRCSSIYEGIQKTLDALKSTQRPVFIDDHHEALNTELMPVAQFLANVREYLPKADGPDNLHHTVANVLFQTSAIMRLAHVQEKTRSGKLVVAGALYDFAGRLGDKGRLYLVDVNGTGTVAPKFENALINSDIRHAADLLKIN